MSKILSVDDLGIRQLLDFILSKGGFVKGHKPQQLTNMSVDFDVFYLLLRARVLAFQRKF